MQKEMFKMLTKVKNNSAIPITEGVYFGNGIAKRNNLEYQIEVKPSFKVIGEGVISEFDKLKKIADKVAIVSIEFLKNTALVKTAKGEFQLAYESVEDFPVFNGIYKNIGSVSLDSKFQTACKFVGKDDLKPQYMQVTYQNGNIYGTNGDILYFDTHTSNLSEELIIWGKYNFLGGDFSVEVSKEFNKLVGDNYTFTYRKFTDRVPNYESVIPKDVESYIVLTKKELLDKADLALLAANKHTSVINFDGDMISSCDLDFNSEYKSTLKLTENVGSAMEVSVNGKLLLSILKEIEEERIEIRHLSPNAKPLVINSKFLLMPVMRGY